MTEEAIDAAPAPADRRRSFVALFLLDMWERFSFYGMTAILFLFATAKPDSGGIGLSVPTAGALVGAYIAAVFLSAAPGAWLGDRILGTYRAALYGAVLIGAGHACLAIPARAAFPAGLLLVAAGTGLLKPNLTVLLGACYPRHAHTVRESAFSMFYMGIQLSAIVAPLVTGFLAAYVNWHAGFGAAAVGMAAGIVCFLGGRRHLGAVGRLPADPAPAPVRAKAARRTLVVLAGAAVLLLADGLAGALRAQHVIAAVGLAGLVVPVVAYRSVRRHPGLSDAERRRVRGYLRVFFASALFWLLFSQSLSLLSNFADRYTDRTAFGLTVPASWFQSLHPLFILLGAPLAAWLWPRLGARAGVAAKFGTGLVLAGLSFLLLAGAAHLAHRGPVSAGWLVGAYLLQATGELALAPVGLSVTVAAAPRACRSQLMGLWWLSAALGAGLGGQLVRLAVLVPTEWYFLGFGLVPIGAAAALAFSRARLADLIPHRIPHVSAPSVPGPAPVPAAAAFQEGTTA